MFTLPDIRVEAGLVSADPVQADTSLILNDATLGKLDTATLGAGITWSDITEWVRSFTVNQQFTRQQGPLWSFQAGTCSVVLDNSEGAFDPDNLDGPFASGGVSQIAIMVPVRVRISYGGVVYPLFVGYADAWRPRDIDGFNGDYTELTLTATDAFKVLAGLILPAISTEGAGEDTGARITRILEQADWYTSGEFGSIDTGNSTLQGITYGSDALSLMQTAADSEIGHLYVGPDGAVTFKNRQSLLTETASNTVQAVFGDSPGTSHTDGTELNCAVISRAFDDTTLANDVQATRTGGTLQQVSDSASITSTLFKRSFEKSDLILENDTDTLSWAQWVLYISKDGENRFESVEIDPFADQDNLWLQILNRTFWDRIQLWVRPPNVTDPISKDCFIAGIEHTCDVVAGTWRTKWTLQSADKYGSFFTLDNSTLGRLNENALAF